MKTKIKLNILEGDKKILEGEVRKVKGGEVRKISCKTQFFLSHRQQRKNIK